MNSETEIEISKETLWSLLTRDEQIEAIRCFWQGESPMQKAIMPQVVGCLAEYRHFREKFVRERSLEWKVNELFLLLPKVPFNAFIDDVIREFLFVKQHEMICAILDAQGTPHNSGLIDEDALAPEIEVFVRGLTAVRGKYSDRDLLLYYGIQLVANSDNPFWRSYEEAVSRPEFEKMAREVFALRGGPIPGAKTNEGVEDEKAALPEANEEFTTLDNLLIKTVVATATGTDGALSSDALEDLVQEITSLGADRHRTYFHLGFLDAVFGKDLRGEFTGSNVARRSWYLTGYLMGRLRSARSELVIEIVKNQTIWWEELLSDGPMSARVMLLPSLVPRLANAGEWRLMRELLEQSRLPSEASRAARLCQTIYEACADLVRRGSSAEATPLLEILLARLEEKKSGLPEQFIDQVKGAALRKLGQAHLREGRFGEAKKLLVKALEQSDFPEAANARTDLGLAEAKFRSLAFLLPKDDEKANATTIRALEKQLKLFEKSVTDDGHATNAHFVLGLIAFHRGHPQKAEDHLSRSLTGMLQKEAAYQSAQLVDWTRFLLAIIIAEQCEPARLNEIRGLVDCAIASPAFFPLHYWERICRHLSLYDDQSVAESTIQHVLKKRGDLGFALLKESGLLTKNVALRTSYRQWLDSQRQSPSKKADELESLLKSAFKDGEMEEATEILDVLEGVAKTDTDCIPHFLSLLKHQKNQILTIWEERDLDITEAALLERIGRLTECGAALQRLFYRYRADGDWAAVEDILEQIEHLKIPEIDVNLLKAQSDHLRPIPQHQKPSTVSLNDVGVLYVGGNETQARYEDGIREDLNRKHPGLVVTFYYPGWTSNWNDHLEKVLKMAPKYNVVVINNFVRTQFGRKLRAACGNNPPWRACTGHGRKSLLHAIEVAACWVAANENKSIVKS